MGTLPVEVGKCVSSDVITSFVCGENVLVDVYGMWRDKTDVITSSLDGVSGRGKAVDVIAWSTGTAGGRVSADIITSRGSIDVID